MKIILDLECTCTDKDEFPRDEMEIIEIGAALFDQGKEISRFQTFCKPTIHPVLTDFCKQLTTITQKQVDTAQSITESLKNFEKWIEEMKDQHNVKDWSSWGFFDKNFLNKTQSELSIVLKELNSLKHINASIEFQKKYKLSRKMGVGKALKFLNLKFDGTQHRAMDDVVNIAKIIYH